MAHMQVGRGLCPSWPLASWSVALCWHDLGLFPCLTSFTQRGSLPLQSSGVPDWGQPKARSAVLGGEVGPQHKDKSLLVSLLVLLSRAQWTDRAWAGRGCMGQRRLRGPGLPSCLLSCGSCSPLLAPDGMWLSLTVLLPSHSYLQPDLQGCSRQPFLWGTQSFSCCPP